MRDVVRIAMWSGPRNISTAMMRAWENREDTTVVDEPLYAAYLSTSGLEHPMRDAVLASQSTDWRQVVRELTTGSVPTRVVYQKHMTHHLTADVERGWIDALTNCFLIREPREVVASYASKRADPTLADLGMPQQLELFERERDRLGHAPPVLLASDVLRDPRRALGLLCDALGLPFSERMLAWPAGPRPSDGVWAPHWYDAVERSTGFAAHQPRSVELPAQLEELAEACRPYFEVLFEARLGAPR